MIKAGNSVFRFTRILIVLMLVLTIIYASFSIFVFLFPKSSHEAEAFLKAHGLADASNPFDTPTSLNLGNTTQTSPPAQTTGSNFGLGTGVTQNPSNSPISNFGSSAYQPLTSSGGGNGTFQYIPLAPIPGVTDQLSGSNISASTGVDGFKKYIQGIFTFGIGLCAALAVIMIIYGGFMYVVNSGNEGKIKEGRDIIYNAVEGLVMALCIVIILQAVNSSLLSGDIFGDFTQQNVKIDVNTLGITPGQTGYPYQQGNQNYGLTSFGDPSLNQNFNGAANYDGTNPRLDTDGNTDAPWDPSHQSQLASGQSVNAFTTPYVVVDNSSEIGQKFVITDSTTGQQVVAVGADTGHGFGEMSPAAAQALGMWKPGQGDNLPNDHITIKPYSGG